MFKKHFKFSLVQVLLLALLFLGAGLAVGINNGFFKSLLVGLLMNEDSWRPEIIEVEIASSLDGRNQKAKVFFANGDNRPLIISFHTWGGDYDQYDPISEYAVERDYNYVHPDFQGANKTATSCCSNRVIADIDDAIAYMVKNGASESNIYMIGLSGGAYTLFCAYLKSRFNAKRYSAWAGISDLQQWAKETKIRGWPYYEDIMACTDGKNFDSRSPLQWTIPDDVEQKGRLLIYAGIYDGIEGSVPITHSINFYNKVVEATTIDSTANKVSDAERLGLLEFRAPLGDYGQIGNRTICLKKEAPSVELIIFDGGHEMVLPFAFEDLMRGAK